MSTDTNKFKNAIRVGMTDAMQVDIGKHMVNQISNNSWVVTHIKLAPPVHHALDKSIHRFTKLKLMEYDYRRGT